MPVNRRRRIFLGILCAIMLGSCIALGLQASSIARDLRELAMKAEKFDEKARMLENAIIPGNMERR